MDTLLVGTLKLPLVGLGTWQLQGKQCQDAVSMALEIGYRHFDTAHLYENHNVIGRAIRNFPREELRITSKFSPSQLTHESVEESCDRAIKELGCDFLDLYLLHCPDRNAPMRTILDELYALKEKGKVREIGVSNFTKRHLQDLASWDIPIAVNQIEFHPYLYQKELWQWCKKNSIQIISYRSLGKGALIADPVFEKIGKKYGKSPAQVSLRWLIEKKIPVIPKASSRKHLEENLDLFDFALDKDDISVLDHLKAEHRFCDGDWTDFNYS